MNEPIPDMGKSEPNKKQRRSWIRTTLWFLLLIFAVNLALQIFMNVNYIRSAQQQTVNENANAVHIFARTVDTELESINESLHELLIQIYNKTELRSGSKMMNSTVKSDINTTMDVCTDATRDLQKREFLSFEDFLSVRDNGT